MGGLFNEGRVPPGSIVDAGAFEGEWACFYAQQDTSRTVHAIDPDAWLVHKMQSSYGESHPNLVPRHGALGELGGDVSRGEARSRGMSMYPIRGPASFYNTSNRSSLAFPTFTLDDLFAHGESLGFAHLDLEGHEVRCVCDSKTRDGSPRPEPSSSLTRFGT